MKRGAKVDHELPRRIAFVIWSLGLGGAEQVVIRLAAALDRRRFDPIICCLNEPGKFAAQAERAGIEVLPFHKRGPIDLKLVRSLAATFRNRRIDAVHTHLWGASVWGRIAARIAGVRRIIVTEHNVDSWKGPHHLLIDRFLAPSTHALVAVSEQVRNFYEGHSVGRGRWKVIYNGIDTALPLVRERGESYRALGIPNDAPVVGLVGRIVAVKAPELFLKAVALASKDVPGLRALVIGDGPLRPEAEAHARRLGVEQRTVFTGLREDVPDLLAGMDVLVFSSTREGLSIAMLEAMAAGVPVVATRVGGNPELIDSGVSGFLVPSGDAPALAAHITDLLLDQSLAQRIRVAARRRVEERFSLAAMVAAYEALYDDAATDSPEDAADA
jgi:glycosyltransferase involved in cell wall biosynthesis